MGISKWLRHASTMVVSAVIDSETGERKFNSRKRKRDRMATSPRRPRRQIRRSVSDVFNCLGPQYFRRAYRMSFESFWILHEALKNGIQVAYREHRIRMKERKLKKISKMSTKSKRIYYKMLLEEKFNVPPVPNGIIDSSIRLACALRYFAGGSTYDLAPLYGISHTEVFNSLWYDCV